MTTCRLSALTSALENATLIGNGDPVITAIAHDSRRVVPGAGFVAIAGVAVDGHRFIADALARGAAGVFAEKADRVPPGVPGAIVPDGRVALARVAAAFFGFPARRMRVIGITGTDGKTTTASLLQSILLTAGKRVGAITTVAATIGGRQSDTGFHTTTPDALAIQTYLAEMADAASEYAIIETTSHGLAQKRVLDCEYDVAAFTNVTPEHLDYHGTFEAYRAAKALLFEGLAKGYRKPGVPKVSVLNLDDPASALFGAYPADVTLTYALDRPADFTAGDIRLGAKGSEFLACTPAGSFAVSIPLVGRYNVANALAAIAIAESQGIAAADIAAGLAAFGSVPGRMQVVASGQPYTVIVDFAHTPNSLRHTLEVARGLTAGRLISVFGCAGLRDDQKRPAMGELSGRLADYVVVTAEDPRTEAVEAINAAIGVGLTNAGRQHQSDWVSIPDREEAIRHALAMAKPGDLVIITGKGHEQSMCFGTTEYPWNDVDAVVRSLAALGFTDRG